MASEIPNKIQFDTQTAGHSDRAYLWVEEAKDNPQDYLLRKEAFESLKLGDYKVAQILTSEQLENNIKSGKDQSLDQSLGLYVLGRSYEAQAQYLDAAKAYQASALISWQIENKALQAGSYTNPEGSTNSDQDLASEIARNAAHCYMRINDKDKAEPLFRQIVAQNYYAKRGAGGRNAENLYGDSVALTNCLESKNQFMQAELVYEGLLSKFEENKNSKFVQLMTPLVLDNLSHVEELQGKFSEALVHRSRSSYLRNLPNSGSVDSKPDNRASALLDSKIKKEIGEAVQDPRDTLLKALKHNKVLAIGEFHTKDAPNLHRTFVASLMQDFRKAGVTHLALELPADEQWKIDRFVKTGQFPEVAAKRSKEFRELGLGFYSKSLDYVFLMEQARRHGLKIKAVDSAHVEQFAFLDNLHKPRRNQDIAKAIDDTLKSNPQNKLVFFGGCWHTANHHPKGMPPTATEILRQKGYKVFSTYAALAEPELNSLNQPVDKYRETLNKVISVESNKAPLLSSLPAYECETIGRHHKLGYWNTVLIYPKLSQNQREQWFFKH
jgi:tetratricopeptide (TPR) repeat protein